MTSNRYTCALCGGGFEKEDSDEAAMHRALKKHGPVALTEPVVVVCDNCFKILEAWEQEKKAAGTWVYPEN